MGCGVDPALPHSSLWPAGESLLQHLQHLLPLLLNWPWCQLSCCPRVTLNRILVDPMVCGASRGIFPRRDHISVPFCFLSLVCVWTKWGVKIFPTTILQMSCHILANKSLLLFICMVSELEHLGRTKISLQTLRYKSSNNKNPLKNKCYRKEVSHFAIKCYM